MMQCHKSLSAVVRYVPGKGRCKWATEITIRVGPVVVATRTAGGRYTQAEALADFRRTPTLYKREGGYEIAQAMKLVA